jgi:hypothetical protein
MTSDDTGLTFATVLTALLSGISFVHVSGLCDGPYRVSAVELSPSSEVGKIIHDYRALCSGKHPTDHSEITFKSLSRRAEEVCLRKIRSILSVEKDFADGFCAPESEALFLKDKDCLSAFHRRHASYGLVPEDLGILYDLVRKEGMGGEIDYQI